MRVILTNLRERPCRSCGEVHPYLTALAGQDPHPGEARHGRCDIPIAVDAADERTLMALGGARKRIPPGMVTVPFPDED
jgi:hypothetical protein